MSSMTDTPRFLISLVALSPKAPARCKAVDQPFQAEAVSRLTPFTWFVPNREDWVSLERLTYIPCAVGLVPRINEHIVA